MRGKKRESQRKRREFREKERELLKRKKSNRIRSSFGFMPLLEQVFRCKNRKEKEQG